MSIFFNKKLLVVGGTSGMGGQLGTSALSVHMLHSLVRPLCLRHGEGTFACADTQSGY
ncbi:hypothetical protein [Pseudomonas sp. S2_A02]